MLRASGSESHYQPQSCELVKTLLLFSLTYFVSLELIFIFLPFFQDLYPCKKCHASMSIYRRDLVDFTGILYVLPSVECLFGQLIGL